MNIRYYHEFRGLDNVLNRFEILTDDTVKSMEIKASPDALSLEYSEARKLDPIRGSQATMNLISESIFQFVDLHTDEMRKYLVKFYRAGSLYWIGWLDSELYGEELSATPPYEVTFKASDFNIMERLRYRDESENRYTDIVPLITHIRRCLAKIGLPFNKLYIGCTTSAEDVALTASETVLHQLYMMSDNFYDEDKEPMSCREVMEEILRPFGLMLVQKYGNLYIYDYNTIKGGLPMKRYGYSTFAYEADETVNFNFGNLHTIGFASTDSSYGFEEMINNVKITSSLYGDAELASVEVNEDTVSQEYAKLEMEGYTLSMFTKVEGIESVNPIRKTFNIYTKKDSNNTLCGAFIEYKNTPGSIEPEFRVKSKCCVVGSSELYYINVKCQAYVNTRLNPFDTKEEVDARDSSRAFSAYCNLYITDISGIPLYYYDIIGESFSFGWKKCSAGGTFPQGRFKLFFSNKQLDEHGIGAVDIFNKWQTNSDALYVPDTGSWPSDASLEMNHGAGLNIAFNGYEVENGAIISTGLASGYVVLEVTNKSLVNNPALMLSSPESYPPEKIRGVLFNEFALTVRDKKKKPVSTDDYEFNSYINKNVKTDFDEVTLKCISANEEKAPIGKANVLKKTGDHYELQLAFTRSGQKDILERLLMCTIHSNFTTKNGKLTVDIKMTDNPALGYVDYEPILSGNYLVVGCKLDFSEAKTTITAVGYSGDTDKLSSIPYE